MPGTSLEVGDLSEVIFALGKVLPHQEQCDEALQHVKLLGAERAAPTSDAVSRWQAAVTVALQYEGDYLSRLMEYARARANPGGRRILDEAWQKVGVAHIERVLRQEDPELGEHVDDLLEAYEFPTIRHAAQRLRMAAMASRRLLTDPLVGATVVASGGESADPQQRCLQLADLAIDVVAATDYLLSLVGSPPIGDTTPFSLEHDVSGHRAAVNEVERTAEDIRVRRIFDAKAAAARVGSRFFAGLHAATP